VFEGGLSSATSVTHVPCQQVTRTTAVTPQHRVCCDSSELFWCAQAQVPRSDGIPVCCAAAVSAVLESRCKISAGALGNTTLVQEVHSAAANTAYMQTMCPLLLITAGFWASSMPWPCLQLFLPSTPPTGGVPYAQLPPANPLEHHLPAACRQLLWRMYCSGPRPHWRRPRQLLQLHSGLMQQRQLIQTPPLAARLLLHCAAASAGQPCCASQHLPAAGPPPPQL
jgi:hypothetical protein